MEQEPIFLTAEQALDAICIDFRQYDPQIMLFCSIIDLISENTVRFKRAPGKAGLWLNRPGRPNMRWLEGRDLIEFMCSAVKNARWTPQRLASVCGRVFHSRAQPASDPASGQEGIRIQIDMTAFHCRQCGRCCRDLDYQHEVTAEDVTRWQALGRQDILHWVAAVTSNGRTIGYRVWIVPETHQRAKICPFLEKNPATNQWLCRIHDVKPRICRNYPVNRKHAGMTGCRGFESG